MRLERSRWVIFSGQNDLFPRIAIVVGGAAHARAVVGQLMGLDAIEQFGAPPHVADALAQQRAHRPLLRWVDVGRGDQVGAQQVSQFFRNRCGRSCFCRRDGLQIERMGQDKSQVGLVAGIGQPVPAEHAFTAHRQAVLVRFDAREEEGEVVFLDVGVQQFSSLSIHDTDVHLVGVQVDSAVELGGGGVILHGR